MKATVKLRALLSETRCIVAPDVADALAVEGLDAALERGERYGVPGDQRAGL